MRGVDMFQVKRWAILACWAALSGAAIGQVSWSLDTTQIQWGEPVVLTAEWLLSVEDLTRGVAAPDQWPAWKDTTEGGLEILSSSAVDTLAAPVDTKADVLLRKTWELTSWDSGFVVVPPAQFGNEETPPLLLRVLTPDVAADAQPRPPEDIVEVKWSWLERLVRALPWLLAIALAAAFLWLGRKLWQRLGSRAKSPQEQPLQTEALEPPHVVALRTLHQLKEEQGWMHGRAKEAQAQASLTLRHYLERRFDLPAAERTTGDIAAMMPGSSVPQPWQPRLIQALEQADAVKFAKGELPELTHLALINAYIDFVLDTQTHGDEEG